MRDAITETAQHLVLLGLRQAACGDGAVEPLLRRVHEGIDQPGHRLALCGRDLGETLPALELRTKLRLGQAEVTRRGGEVSEEAEVPEPRAEASEEGEVAGVETLLEGVSFRLRQPARGNGRVDAVGQRLLQRVAQLAR